MTNRYLRLLLMMICGLLAAAVSAKDDESPSKMINNIKRDGSYIYAEATASTEADARSICDDLIKVEISRYAASQQKLANADQVIIKDAKYECQYLTMPRGDMTRVFIYVKKSDIEAGGNASMISAGEVKQINAAQERAQEVVQTRPEPRRVRVDKPVPASKVTDTAPEVAPAVQQTAPVLVTSATGLSKWQNELLEDIAASKDMAEAKKKLNRYKAQYKVKRIGDNTTAPKGSSVLCYAVYGDGATLEALLAPGDNSPFIDMISGDSSDISQYPGKKYLWFTLSK